MAQLNEFGKAVKHRLIDVNKSQVWLAKEVSKRTGLFVDSRYLSKIFEGKRNPPTIMAAIADVLSMGGDRSEQRKRGVSRHDCDAEREVS